MRLYPLQKEEADAYRSYVVDKIREDAIGLQAHNIRADDLVKVFAAASYQNDDGCGQKFPMGKEEHLKVKPVHTKKIESMEEFNEVYKDIKCRFKAKEVVQTLDFIREFTTHCTLTLTRTRPPLLSR